ncbi:MAG: hypothetical protein ACW99A_18305 [Candidatus Kariarchaeaceae archaeon]|jgi:hypothetical protein
MVFTKVTNYSIKTNEHNAAHYKEFISGELGPTTPENVGNTQKQYKNKLRQDLIGLIMTKYPLEFDKDTNFARYNVHELNSILNYGDHRAEIDPEYIEIDYSPTYYKDPNTGKTSISHHEIDYEHQTFHERQIAKKLKGYNMLRTLYRTTPKLVDCGHISRQKEIRKLLRLLPPQYSRAATSILNDHLEEVAKASLSFYTINFRKFLAAVIILKMRKLVLLGTSNIGAPNNDAVCKEFNVDSNSLNKYLFEARGLSFLQFDRSLLKNSLDQKKKSIISSAKNMTFQLADHGFVFKPAINNQFVDEIENHYPDVFEIKRKPERVIAIITAKLFDRDVNTREMAVALYDGAITDVTAKDAELLTKQVSSWMRRNKHEIGRDVKTGRIRRLYLSEIEEYTPVMNTKDSESTEQKIILPTTSIDGYTYEYRSENDSVIVRQKEVMHLLRNRGLIYDDQSIRDEKHDLSLISNSICQSIDSEVMFDEHQLHGYHTLFYNNIENRPKIFKNTQTNGDDQENHYANVPLPEFNGTSLDQGLKRISHKQNKDENIDFCYLGYPGALTRLLAWKTVMISNTKKGNSCLGENTPSEGQNPSLVWLVDKEKFFEQADQVMLKKNGLFGKWDQYITKYNAQFLEPRDKSLSGIQDLVDILFEIAEYGNCSAVQPLSNLKSGSIVIYPNLRDLLKNELQSSILQMTPNNFRTMKQDTYNHKIMDFKKASDERIFHYQEMITYERQEGTYADVQNHELDQLSADFHSAQTEQFENKKKQLLSQLRSEMDQFIDIKAKLASVPHNSEEYHNIQQSMNRFGVDLSEEAKKILFMLPRLIEEIYDKHKITVLIGGMLSKNLKISQLLRTNRLDTTDIIDNSPEQVLDRSLMDLCITDYPSQSIDVNSASLVVTNIPNKLSISTYSLPNSERMRMGLEGVWTKNDSIDISNLVEWVS